MIDSNVSSVETARLKKHTIMLEQGTINYIRNLVISRRRQDGIKWKMEDITKEAMAIGLSQMKRFKND